MLTFFDDVAYIVKSPMVIFEVMLDAASLAVNLSEMFVPAMAFVTPVMTRRVMRSSCFVVDFIFVVFDASVI